MIDVTFEDGMPAVVPVNVGSSVLYVGLLNPMKVMGDHGVERTPMRTRIARPFGPWGEGRIPIQRQRVAGLPRHSFSGEID